MAEFDQKGGITNLKEILKAKGWEIGMKVIRKADKMQGEVIEIENDAVTVRHVDASEWKYSPQSFLEGKWKELVAKAPPTLVDWTKCPVIDSPEVASQRLKGWILHCMAEQWADKMKDTGSIEVQCNPKNVRVTKNFATGKLILPCATSRILLEKQEGDAGGLVIGTFDSLRVVLAGSTVFPREAEPGKPPPPKGSINPFWIVKATEKKDDANMQLITVNQNRELKLDTEVALPIMKNFKKIDAGDSLLVFSSELSKKRLQDVETPVPKRARA